MDYDKFEKKLISEILSEKKKCIETINKNEKIVQAFLKDPENPDHIRGIVIKFKNIILEG